MSRSGTSANIIGFSYEDCRAEMHSVAHSRIRILSVFFIIIVSIVIGFWLVKDFVCKVTKKKHYVAYRKVP